MSSSRPNLPLLQFQAELVDRLDGVRRSDKALKIALRLVADLFDADHAAVAVTGGDGLTIEARYLIPRGGRWDPELLALATAERRPKLPPELMAAAIRRRGRTWGHLLLRRDEPAFSRTARKALTRAAATISRQLERIDRLRLAEVRSRMDRKVLEQIDPKDLSYQLLHALRSLTRYDHSAAVMTFDGQANALRLAAEQIAWRKGKSGRVGASLELTDEVLTLLETGELYGFDRPGDAAPVEAPLCGGWQAWLGRGGELLAAGLNRTRVGSLDEAPRPARSLLVAPLVARDRLLGVLEIASCRAGTLGRHEAELVASFLPQVAVAIGNLERAASLEHGLLAAERKHVMANLARGVSHDVNNALGAVLPLVQQMLADLTEGAADTPTLRADLEQVEASVQVCRRIFGGMLSFAHGAAQHGGAGHLGLAVQSALAVLEESLRRQEIELVVDLPVDLPPARGSRGDLEQLLLNLVGNARDAMPQGGRLTIIGRLRVLEEARADGGAGVLELVLTDTGRGIGPEDMDRIQEPFFTTKRAGNGLGLSICRSIVWTMGGSMTFASHPDQGTAVTLLLPATGLVP